MVVLGDQRLVCLRLKHVCGGVAIQGHRKSLMGGIESLVYTRPLLCFRDQKPEDDPIQGFLLNYLFLEAILLTHAGQPGRQLRLMSRLVQPSHFIGGDTWWIKEIKYSHSWSVRTWRSLESRV